MKISPFLIQLYKKFRDVYERISNIAPKQREYSIKDLHFKTHYVHPFISFTLKMFLEKFIMAQPNIRRNTTIFYWSNEQL